MGVREAVSYISLRVKNEGWGVKGGGWYHKFVYECNLIPLVTEGCMQSFLTLVQPPIQFEFYKSNFSAFFCLKKNHPTFAPPWVGGKTNKKFINQISRHFRQIWTLFIKKNKNHPTSTPCPHLVGGGGTQGPRP